MAEMPAYWKVVETAVVGEGFVRGVFSGPVRLNRSTRYKKVVVRPVVIKGERMLSFSYWDSKHDTTKNVKPEAAGEILREVLAIGFANVHLKTAGEEVDVRLTKKGEALIGRTKVAVEEVEAGPHNRVKELPLMEGRADRVLQVMGIMTADGKVRPTMRGKFTQINEFLKLLEHVLGEVVKSQNMPSGAPAPLGMAPSGPPLQILDCGCGASYLTIATHHWLNDVKGIPTKVLGVDFNDELIRKSTERSAELHCRDLEFAAGKIGALEQVRPDIVLALHACDTATDDALAQGIRSGAKLILAAPCCHKDMHGKLKAEVLGPIHRQGILHQRLADVATDAFRALILRIMGYRAEVIEFVAPEHTGRNLMIRAVKGVPMGEKKFVAEYEAMKAFFGVTPYLETVLGKSFSTTALTTVN